MIPAVHGFCKDDQQIAAGVGSAIDVFSLTSARHGQAWPGVDDLLHLCGRDLVTRPNVIFGLVVPADLSSHSHILTHRSAGVLPLRSGEDQTTEDPGMLAQPPARPPAPTAGPMTHHANRQHPAAATGGSSRICQQANVSLRSCFATELELVETHGNRSMRCCLGYTSTLAPLCPHRTRNHVSCGHRDGRSNSSTLAGSDSVLLQANHRAGARRRTIQTQARRSGGTWMALRRTSPYYLPRSLTIVSLALV